MPTRSGNYSTESRDEVLLRQQRIRDIQAENRRRARLEAPQSPEVSLEQQLDNLSFNSCASEVEVVGGDNEVEAGAAAPVKMVNYDMQSEEDDAGAIQNARDVKLPFNRQDVRLWFSLVESKMQFAGIKKQWSKRQVLVQLIPPDLHNDFKQYLIQQEDAAGNLPYYTLKAAIVKQFGPKRADGFDKAISRVMNGTPSQLGRQIINDICPDVNPLVGCHCADVVLGIWRRSLPQVVRNAIADTDFNSTTYSAIFDKADSVWTSNSASVSVVSALEKNEASAAASVAAVGGRGGGRGARRGGRGQSSGNRGGGTSGGGAPRHSDNPPSNACNLHKKFGKAAWRCGDRHTCPWRDFESPRPRHNRNIVGEAEMTIID